MSETVGSRAFGTAWPRRTRDSREALGLGRRHVVLAAGLDDRRAHQDGVLADQPEADRRQRQDEVASEVEELVERTTCTSCPSSNMPAVGNQPSAVAKMTRRIIPNRKYGIE